MAYRQDLFTHTVNQLRNGRTQEELSEKLNEVVNACRDTGKVGEITLKIKVYPDKGDTGQYFLKDDVTTKAPKPDRGQTIMFGTPEGNLQRNDPRQGDLPLKEVAAEQTPVREVASQQPQVKTV